MSTSGWRRAGIGALALTFVLSACKLNGFNDGPGKAAAATATSWLVRQQQPDGGFELAGSPGFETPDAVLAIAESAQRQSDWNANQARTAVAAVKVDGKSALDAIDGFADGPLNAGQAAKVIVLVAKPLGYSATNFDPQGDGAVNLGAIVNAGRLPNGSYGAFNATLFAMLARKVTGSTILPQTVAYVRAAQQANGGWSFAADPNGTDVDVDTTSLALQGLIAAGAKADDPAVQAGIALLARSQQRNGAWQSFGADDPNSTSTAMLAITAAGYDPTQSCWRTTAVPSLAGVSYGSPSQWLRTQQTPAGNIASPSDQFGLNTFATSQSIQGLRRGWLPVAWLDAHLC